MADSGIDPRYAAQFQRGFDPAQHAPVPPPQRRGPEPIESLRPPVVLRVPDPPRIAESPPPLPVPLVAELDPSAADDSDVPVRSRWEWTLPALAAALIVAAALLFWTTATETGMNDGTWGQADYVANSMRMLLPGPLLVAGVLALTVWIVARGLTSRAAP
ncbi:hypothetical protein [Pseudolysinimonas sp.]|jgi:hypothetical protein|uniref:hypothetical protein n=1 Tax=Pseudolysinimonas sp. TaxID=2680009 RepID=UPI0037848DCE